MVRSRAIKFSCTIAERPLLSVLLPFVQTAANDRFPEGFSMRAAARRWRLRFGGPR
jgi:hypothetical protein